MEGFVFPVLSVIIFVPIVAAVIMLFIDSEQRDLIRGIAIAAAAIVLVLSAAVFFGYNAAGREVTAQQDAVLPARRRPDRPAPDVQGWAGLRRTVRLDHVAGDQLSSRCRRSQCADGAADRSGRRRRGADFLAYRRPYARIYGLLHAAGGWGLRRLHLPSICSRCFSSTSWRSFPCICLSPPGGGYKRASMPP